MTMTAESIRQILREHCTGELTTAAHRIMRLALSDSVITAAEQRGAEREREACARLFDRNGWPAGIETVCGAAVLPHDIAAFIRACGKEPENA